jgi:aspartate/methionine/tyrosine aminotransferase
MSKAFGLPGIRVGWVVSPNTSLLGQLMTARDYTTIAVSQLDDGIAAYALSKEVYSGLMSRNLRICRTSIDILRGWLENNRGKVECVLPQGSGTAFVRIFKSEGKPVEDREFATLLLEKTGVNVVPGGWCFGDGEDAELKGYVRVTLGESERLADGLKALSTFLSSQ